MIEHDMDDRIHDYASPYVDRQSAAVIQIDSGKLFPVALALVAISLAISCVSIGLVIGATNLSQRAERETRLQRLEVDELRAAIARAGIVTHEEGVEKP